MGDFKDESAHIWVIKNVGSQNSTAENTKRRTFVLVFFSLENLANKENTKVI